MLDLKNDYNREDFLLFLKDFLPEDHLVHEKAQDLPLEYTKSITDAVVLSECKSLGIKIFEVEHSGSKDARVSLAREAFRIMADTLTNRALVVFKSSDDSQWRLSLMTIQLDYDESKNKIKKSYSNARRYSYMLGQEAKINTPYKYLISLGKVKDVGDLEKRFSIEVVNNEFYKEIAKLYDELIGTEKITRKLTYPNSGDESQEFAVRLIGRIIFCWFLREKKSKAGVPLIPANILSRGASGQPNYYHNVLVTLFFEVLNRPIQRRTRKFQEGYYKDIPYLNGGLFSDDTIDYYTFDKNLELSVPGLVDVPDPWLHDLFDLLERFNFTVDENTSYDTDLSIDPEMLGRVFENLLARINPETGETVRKSTGSFYTPREIVEYMVDSSLSEYLSFKTHTTREKIAALISYNPFDDLENELSIEESTSVLEALSTLTVLDPACGSGAFPIGMLQKIVFIITKLDPKAEWWLAKQLEGASPELRKEFANRSVDYVRKLGIIRQTIFGVDIQPIATEISRLRCFLTLIVDEAVNDTQENRGIRPLPNLDFKFVTANSLIPLPDPGDKKGDISKVQVTMFEETSHIDELKQIRNEYFSSTNHERNELQSRFINLQKKMILTNVDVFKGAGSKLYDTLSRWDPFEHKPNPWFDSEWMFGIQGGFDVVIGNPPYINVFQLFKNQEFDKSVYKNLYATARGAYDIYVLFFERGLNQLSENGILAYITPNKYLSAEYAQALRDLLARNASLLNLIDVSKVSVFEAAVYPVVSIFQSGKHIIRPPLLGEGYREKGGLITIRSKPAVTSTDGHGSIDWSALINQESEWMARFNALPKLTEFAHISASFAVSDSYKIIEYVQESRDELSAGFNKFVISSNIHKHLVTWGRNVSYLKHRFKKPIVESIDALPISDHRKQTLKKDKIIIAGMTKHLRCFYDERANYIPSIPTIVIYDFKINPQYLVALLNSKFIDVYYRYKYDSLSLAGGYLRVGVPQLSTLPIITPEKDQEDKVTRLVDKLGHLSTESKRQEIISEIDTVINSIYNLSLEEIQIIENLGDE